MDNEKAVTQVSFDYKIDSGEYFNLALLPDWSNYFGYFNFNAQGAAYTYEGVTTEKLDNGYIHVIMDMSALTQISGMPSDVLKMLFVRGSGDWSNANGEITNIFLSYAAENAPRGEAIEEGIDKTIILENTEKLESLSFDYMVSDGTFNVALLPDWSNFFGYFAFDANGNVDAYDGVTLEALEDGYTRVTFDIAALTKYSGEPNNVIDIVYIRGAWTDATGYIDNIQYRVAQEEPEVPTEPEPTEPEPTEPVIRGKAFSAGSNSYIYTDSTDKMTKFSFEYKVTNDGAMDVLIGNDNGQYGNFYLNANGTITSVSDTTAKTYAGVTTETLADGYIRVTFQLDALENVYRGTPGFVIGFIRIRATSTAEGYVDNVVWESAQTDVIRGEAFTAGSSKRISFDAGVYSTVTFDYKFTEGEEMQFAVMQDSNGSAYYGRFTLTATGEKTDYAGVEVKALSDGYYRVTINIAEVTVTNNTPTELTTFYIRGSGTSASGYIDNLTLV